MNDDLRLILVNKENPLKEEFSVDLVKTSEDNQLEIICLIVRR